MISLVDVLRAGGHYWRQINPESPGHAIAVPVGTPISIALEGSQSHRYLNGECRFGGFLMEDGRRFDTASEAVNAVREPSSNAFLFFRISYNGKLISADDYRRLPETEIDPAEEEAVRFILSVLRLKPGAAKRSLADLSRFAAIYIHTHPEQVDDARERLAALDDIEVEF